MDKEIKYFLNKINEVTYEERRFTLSFEDGRYLFGIVSAQGETTTYANAMQYKTIYDTIMDLDCKIKLSFNKAINYAYSNNVRNNYSVFEERTEEEIFSYYFIENALFRTIILWDMLAQLYRLYYKIPVRIDSVFYNKIFNPNSILSKGFKSKAKEIYNYFKEENDVKGINEWKGNHKFVADCRNKMTHRNAPSVATLSDYDINLKHHPAFMLKRVIEDYSVVSKFIKEFIDKIEVEVMDTLTK